MAEHGAVVPGLAVGENREGAAMKHFTARPLLALALVALVLLGGRPLVRSADAPPTPVRRVATPTAALPVAPTPTATPMAAPTTTVAPAPAVVAPADSAFGPCALAAHHAACAGDAGELAAYGLEIAELSAWTAFGLRRFVEAVERLADALGGGGDRARRIARLALALGTDAPNGRIVVAWQAEPQARDGNPVRGGYAASRLYFNPNTLFLDTDTPEEALGRAPQAFWWLYVHELAHLWDERSAPAAPARLSARLRQWVRAQDEAGVPDEYPSSYAVIGGPLEAFAESVAATVTGDAPMRTYYGSPRDTFVRTVLCEAVGCR